MRKFVAQFTLMALLVAPVTAFAGSRTEQTKHYLVDGDGVALGGYDPVSYFGTPNPSKGDKNITAEVDGVVYRFASDANRQAFLAGPEKYKPAYGGWCATAMAAGKKVEVNPRNYRVTGGRLFLFYKDPIHDAQDDWKKDETGLRTKADDNWSRVSGEKPVRQ
jgi:hypothetical protein